MKDVTNQNAVVEPEEETVERNDKVSAFGAELSDLIDMGAALRSAIIFRVAKKLSNPNCTFAKTAIGRTVKTVAEVGAHIELAKMGCDFITTLAQKIDRFLDNGADVEEEEVVEEIAEEIVEEVIEEVAVEEPAVVEEPVVEAFAAVEPVENDSDDDEDEEDSLPAGLASMKLDYIDVMEEPEKYQEMLAQEARGEIQLVTRYRRSFRSRMIQSQGNVQDYYNEIKNLLLSYKGVKDRISWGNESFNKGRNYIAKVNAKTKTLYVYLAIDPTTLEDAKYEVVDVSSKKKYAAVPTLIKVKGDRKFKYAMDLLRQICENDMALPPVKNFEAQDYHAPYQNTEELVADGCVKKMVAAIPVVTAE